MDEHVRGERADHRSGRARSTTGQLRLLIEDAVVPERAEECSERRVDPRRGILAGSQRAHAQRSEQQEVMEANDVFHEVPRVPVGARGGCVPRLGRHGVRDPGKPGADPPMPFDQIVHDLIIQTRRAKRNLRWTPARARR